MDLFQAALPTVSSGAVPREVWPGVVWDETTEVAYVCRVRAWFERFPIVALEDVTRQRAEQSIRWGLELGLLNMTLQHEAARAAKTFEAADKRRLHAEWLRTYGEQLTETIVQRIKKGGRQ